MVDEPAEIERRLAAGDWLRASEIAALLGMSRTTVHRLFLRGTIGYRSTPGRQRLGDPVDVRRLLTESREVRRGPAES